MARTVRKSGIRKFHCPKSRRGGHMRQAGNLYLSRRRVLATAATLVTGPALAQAPLPAPSSSASGSSTSDQSAARASASKPPVLKPRPSRERLEEALARIADPSG